MSLVGVIDSFKTGTYSVSRTATSTYGATGRLVTGSPTVFNIDASIQPVSGRELQALPEAFHTQEVRVIYTVTELQTHPDPDVITIDGEDWDVFRFERWQAFGSSNADQHFRAFASRKSVQ